MADAYWFIFAVGLLQLVLLALALRRINAGAGNVGDVIREELRLSREEAGRTQRDVRGEIARSIESIQHRFDAFRGSSEQRFDSMPQTVDDKLQSTHDQASRASREL